MIHMKDIRLGISPCPNDTFIFYHLLHRQKLPFKIEPVILDVEELNRRVLSQELDVSKVSFALAGRVINRYLVLESGAALGRGCGPLVLARRSLSKEELSGARVAIPGEHTTAALLFKLFSPKANELVEMPFNKIVDAICSGQVDAGCVIHETRFTYRDFGLEMICDLGKWWEETTGMPIPLGGIIAKRTLPFEQLSLLEEGIRTSMAFAEENFHEVQPFISGLAQEISPEVQKKHISLYVNEYSRDLGQEGRAAIRELFKRGAEAGFMSDMSVHKSQIFLSQLQKNQ